MKHHALIENFWKINQEQSVGSNAIAMYLFLLKVWKEKGQKEFKLSDVKLAEKLELARQTIKPTRNKLFKLGLINFNIRNGAACEYFIIQDFQNQKKANSLEFSKDSIDNKTAKRTDNDLKEIIKTQKNQFENLKNNSTTAQSLLSQNHDLKNNEIPNFKEFLDFAKSLEIYTPILDILIEEKYNKWIEDDWKNSYGRPITNWNLLLKSTIPYLINNLNYSSIELKIPKIQRPKNI